MRESESTPLLVEGPDPAITRWMEAHEAHDDEAALDRAAALQVSPLVLRLCLPACWLRARGLRGLEDFVGSLLEAATGPERAILAVAAVRLHPAALSTAGVIAPQHLLFAAAQGALLGHQAARARRWFSLCTFPHEPWLARLAAIEEARASAVIEAPLLALPPGPDAVVARSLFGRIATRAQGVLAGGRPREALGLLELARTTAADARPAVEPPASLLIAAGELRCLLGLRGEAEADFEAAERALQGPSGGEKSANQLALGRARLALEEDEPTGATAYLRGLVEGRPGAPGRAAALSLQGAAEAALGRWAEADQCQRAALARLHEEGREEGEEAASCFHWLGLGQLARGGLAEAEALLQQACGLRGAVLWPDHPDRAGSLVALGVTLAARGRLAEAERSYREARGMLRRLLGEEDPRTILATSRLATLLLARRRWDEAEPLVLGLLARAAGAADLPEATRREELGRWREASERVRVGQTEEAERERRGLPTAESEEPLTELIGTAPLDDEGLLGRLASFAGYVVLVHRESGGVLTVTEREGFASSALIFTSAELASAFLAQSPMEVRGWFDPMTMNGHALFELLPAQQVDGLLFNCLGPWPRAASIGLGAAVLACR